MLYYTDRNKLRKRNKMSEIISNTAWKGINQLVTNLLHNNNLAKDFFKTSEVFITSNTSTNIIVGTDEQQFRERLYGVIPNIKSVIENKSGDIYSVVVREEKFEDFEVIPAEYKTIEEEGHDNEKGKFCITAVVRMLVDEGRHGGAGGHHAARRAVQG